MNTNAIWKPYMLALVRADGYSYIGEVMSYITPDNTLMIRRVPGHPGTLEEHHVNVLMTTTKHSYVHYAEVEPFGIITSFPVDMLRYERAAPLNFFPDDTSDHPVDLTFGFDKRVVAMASVKAKPEWTLDRWRSFGWTIRPFKSERIVVGG
jgi:hypothetical protein